MTMPYYLRTLCFGDLGRFLDSTHTPLTYHRTWETGVEVMPQSGMVSAPNFFVFHAAVQPGSV